VGADGDAAQAGQPSEDQTPLERERQLVETLSRLTLAVGRLDDLEAIVQLVTDEATVLTGAQFGAFFYNVVRRDGEAYSLYTISGVPIAEFERFPMPRATDIFRPTFEGTATIRLEDVRADPRYGKNPPYEGMPPGHLPVRSYLAVPVFTPDEAVLGGLFFGHEQVGVFTADHERIVGEIAIQAGVAIDKAQLVAAERSARAVAEARANAAAALEFVEDGIVMVDKDGFIRLWNRAAAQATGLDGDAVLDRPIGEAVPGWERIVLNIPVGPASERVTPSTLPLDTLAGRELWLSIYGVAFESGTVYAFRDVTGQQTLDALRADMIATVSHELRTPVTSIYGAAQTIRRRNLQPDVVEQLLAIIDSESERLTHLVDDILLTSQLDSNAISVASEAFDPVALVQETTQAAAGGAESSIVIETPGEPVRVAADREKVHQVLSNLIENALKYGSPGGTETIVVRIKEAGNQIRLEVADEGPGIPPREHLHIFEKFYRLDPHLQKGIQGTGLGLYICRELVRRMQGRIGLDSSPDGGATFWFELPRAGETSTEATSSGGL
jgi:PAS domain S-box-containing protein